MSACASAAVTGYLAYATWISVDAHDYALAVRKGRKAPAHIVYKDIERVYLQEARAFSQVELMTPVCIHIAVKSGAVLKLAMPDRPQRMLAAFLAGRGVRVENAHKRQKSFLQMACDFLKSDD